MNLRPAFRSQRGNDQSGPGPQVRRRDIRSGVIRHAGHDRGIPLDLDLRSHPGQLIHIFEPALEDALRHDARAIRQSQNHRDLRLHIRRKSRIRQRLDMCVDQPLVRRHPDRVVRDLHLTSDLLQLRRQRLQMLRNDIVDCDIAAGRRRRKHIRPGLDLVRDDGIFRPVQLLHAADADHIRPRALDLRAHAVEEVRTVNHMRLLRRILDDRHALREARRHHDVDGRAHRHHIEINMAADQIVSRRDDHPVLNADIRAQCAESLDMLINRPEADVASLRQRHLRPAVLPEQRTDQIIGAADFADRLVHNRTVHDLGSIDPERVAVYTGNDGTDTLDGTENRADITHIRHILHQDGFICHNGRGENRQRRVLGTRDIHLSAQGIASLDRVKLHVGLVHFCCFVKIRTKDKLKSVGCQRTPAGSQCTRDPPAQFR